MPQIVPIIIYKWAIRRVCIPAGAKTVFDKLNLHFLEVSK